MRINLVVFLAGYHVVHDLLCPILCEFNVLRKNQLMNIISKKLGRVHLRCNVFRQLLHQLLQFIKSNWRFFFVGWSFPVELKTKVNGM